MANEALMIADVSFVVTSQIDRAPQWTMVRELTMNAIEAASNATGEKIVHWEAQTHEGIRKAAIWNTGPGMDAAQLKAATELACKVDKTLALDGNFGIGAKVSALGSNKFGLRFRSCKNGKVSQVMLGYRAVQFSIL
jgi:sensor histidine kinase regulating citrate/malate metabolism